MRILLRLILGCAVALPVLGTAAADPPATLVLDEGAYWRAYVRFGPDRLGPRALKAEGETLLGERGLARLRRQVRRWNSPPYVDPENAVDLTKTDWRDHALFFVTQVANVGCNDERISFHTRTPPAPKGWYGPEFDAGAWTRRRLPLLVGNFPDRGIGHGVGEMRQPLVRSACFRTTFHVANPAARTTLSLTFRGGTRVFLNGRELARSHLPDGGLGPDAAAEPYPKEAYVLREAEASPYWLRKMARRVGEKGFIPYCPDLAGDADRTFAGLSARHRKKHGGAYYRGIVNRAGWERITRLRNRTLGPLTVPTGRLRKGRNVLAVEVRAADLHPIVAACKGMDWGRGYIMGARFHWAHARLLDIELRSADPDAPSALERPPGVHVWVEDPHRRLHAGDWGRGGGTVRLVGAANGTYAGQIAVSSDRRLTGFQVSAGPLVTKNGRRLPASAVRVRSLVPHPASEMVSLGQWRGLPEIVRNPVCTTSWMSLLRYGPPSVRETPPAHGRALEQLREILFFDHITTGVPGEVPAGRCLPIWLSVRVPGDAEPGAYRGTVRVAAEGMQAVSVPVELEVVGWRLPGPRRFQSFFAGEQSPYGVAKQYKVDLWSDRHFRLLEPSFRQLGRLGGRWLFVPVIQVTEFGNLKDSMVRWIREADGSLAFDFRILDRYLDLATRHMGRPDVVCFVVAHGTHAGAPATVSVLDRRTGETETLDLSKKSSRYEEHWGAFGAAVYEHMRAKGLADTLHWGYGWDGIGDAALLPVLTRAVPEAVRWARGSHAPNRAPGGWARAFTASSFIYGIPMTEQSRRGWRREDLWMINPRAGCSVVSANGHSPPFAYRMLTNRALVAGCRGIARIGADYWDDTFYQGYEGRAWAGSLPGMGCVGLLWPGPDGAETSQRAEMLLEGIQEAEVRICLEQALAGGALPEPVAARARRALRRQHRETLYVPVGRIGVQIQEYCVGWQDRSRALYHAAAELARTLPFGVRPGRIERELPARSRVPLRLTLCNWTARPRRWAAAADPAWLVPDRAAGTLTGHEHLTCRVDTRRLEPGGSAEGVLTVNDADGSEHPVKVVVHVGPVFEFVVGKAYDYLGKPGHAASFGPKYVGDFATYNVPVGGRAAREFVFVNQSGAKLAFRINSPAPWMQAEPAAGTLGPRERTTVCVTAAPPDRDAARHDLALTVREVGGPATQAARMIVHVIPPYRRPEPPKGPPVFLADLPKTRVRAHKSRAYWYGTSDRRRADYGPKFDEKKNLCGGTPQATEYDIAGKGYAAFSAQVKMVPRRKHVGEASAAKSVHFEVRVDGELRAQSGRMGAADEARLLVVRGLEDAKTLTLRVRWDRPEPKYLGGTVGSQWLEPAFHLPAEANGG
jgi:hypothetical protein